jgi:CubicO group peptidase (beta-lactamase class C family)
MPAPGCGMRRMRHPAAELRDAVERGVVPAVAFACGVGADEHARHVAGVTAPTCFDLASLTKVVATTPAALALVADGRVRLDQTLRDAGLDAGTAADRTVHQLLSHTAGLRDTRRFYLDCADADAMWRSLRAEPLVDPPGTRVRYSDLGFLWLGALVAHLTGEPFDRAARRLVLDPLGMRRTTTRPPASEAAPTETGVAAPGEVHDRNARLLGGAAGHAGLFAPLDDVVRAATWWAGADDVVTSVHYRDLAVSDQTSGLPGGRRGLGWARRGDGYDVLDGGWSAAAVSHTGFTGTSIAVDRTRGWWAVLLTNALHLGRDVAAIRLLRRRVHAQTAALLATESSRSTARPAPTGRAAHA